MKLYIVKIWISSIVLMIVISQTASSQSFYTSINAGYGFMMNSMNGYGLGMYNQKQDESGSYRESYDFSLGEGMNFGFDFGYKITEHIAAELGFSYLKGETHNFERNYNEELFQQSRVSGEMYRINPSIVIFAKEGVITPYAKFGVVFGIGTVEYIDKSGNNERIVENTGGTSIGISGALGIDFKLFDNFSCFIQFNSINMSYYPEKGEVTKMIVQGQDVLSEMPISEKQMRYKNKIYENQVGPDPDPNQDPNQPREVLGMSYPFGSFGINLGVKFTF